MSYTALRVLCTIVTALVFGTMFWGLGFKRSKAQDLFNAMGFMYTSVLFTGALHAFTVQQVVVLERRVFYRERAAGMYSAMPFSFAMIVGEVPYVLGQAIIYSGIVYSMIGFEWRGGKFWWYLLIMFLTFLYSDFLGMMSVAMTPNLDTASIFSIACFGIWNLFSGFLIPRPVSNPRSTTPPFYFIYPFFSFFPIAFFPIHTLYGEPEEYLRAAAKKY
ncbi:unnamed protein product [Cuscuta epithymum]|uniref:ABC-2 type transporter transmembrane domain-containing protein n=1 Tax=Cuscuta epithymum TaxID=186058 RepID=A0AAV0D4H0_9ASTE|nr:unnamed protein product [Cuscuta epithymum]